MSNFKDLNGSSCYVIAEAGLNHNGSIEIAKKLIDLAHIAGSNAVKFQKRTVQKLAVKETLNAKDSRFPEFGNTYKEVREHLEFTFEQYQELKEYTDNKNMDFIVTGFDIEAIDFLIKLKVKSIKLASHSLTNTELLEYVSSKKIPVILSTGMADFEEIDKAVEIFKSKNSPLSLLHCVSSYPTPTKDCNLSMIQVLKERYGLQTGYSGHELGYLPSLIAVSNGAEIIERHYTLDNDMIGFDHKMSLSPKQFIEMVKFIRDIDDVMGNGKKTILEAEWITRNKYHVSMVSKKTIKNGEILTKDLVEYKNPGTGIPYKDSYKIYGKTAVKDIPKDTLLSYKMFK